MSEPIGIALFGCGTVGSGVAKLLLDHADRLATRAGRPLQLRRVVVRQPTKPRPVALPPSLITTDWHRAVHDPNVQIVVELVGGHDWAKQAVLAALQAGKHVVTANKALLAHHGSEIFEAARRHERTVAFEASVAGGVPIIAALAQAMAANQIQSLQGILNGTCNFILTAMSDQDQDYTAALADAQQLGFAEADPTLDVDGSDSAHKLAVLARIAFGVAVPPGAIQRRGIRQIATADIAFARELGYSIKLLAEAWLCGSELALHVEPVLVKRGSPLAEVRGAYNAVRAVGDAVGDTLYYGPGAGMMPTASAVVADLIDLAVGRAQRTFQTLKLWEANPANVTVRPTEAVRSRFYLRLNVADRPGVLADVARVLAAEGISIASVIQHEAREDQADAAVPLVIMTHTAATGRFRRAHEAIHATDYVRERGAYYPVAD